MPTPQKNITGQSMCERTHRYTIERLEVLIHFRTPELRRTPHHMANEAAHDCVGGAA